MLYSPKRRILELNEGSFFTPLNASKPMSNLPKSLELGYL
jgi:hypothetical protein